MICSHPIQALGRWTSSAYLLCIRTPAESLSQLPKQLVNSMDPIHQDLFCFFGLTQFISLGGDSRALGVVCPSFNLLVGLGLGYWCLEGCGVSAPFPPCARALLSPSTLEGRFGGCHSQGCHGYPTRSARFHSWPHPPF